MKQCVANMIIGVIFTALAIYLENDTIFLLYITPQIAVIGNQLYSILEILKRNDYEKRRY